MSYKFIINHYVTVRYMYLIILITLIINNKSFNLKVILPVFVGSHIVKSEF